MSDKEITRERAALARRDALTNGTDAVDTHRARRRMPVDVDTPRILTFRSTLTARKEFLARHQCDCSDTSVICGCGGRTFWERAAPDTPSDVSTEWIHLSGVASVTDTPYEMWDFYGPYVERVSRDAFSASLQRQPDVAFLCNHEGLTLARTRAGSLTLSIAPEGLTAEAYLNPLRSDAADLITAIRDGCVDQMSFAAMLVDGQWSADFTEFTLTELDLHAGDVSAVNFGANPSTHIGERARRMIEQVDDWPEAAARSAWKALDRRFRPIQTAEVICNGDKPTVPDVVPMGRSISLVHAALMAADD